jgi:hypothetical protein
MPDGHEQAYQERLDRIAEIFASLVAHAEVSARHRCPYRDRDDQCTALFRCRNQLTVESDVGALACGHDGTFDYRTAWETNPRLQVQVKQKITDIKAEAEARRRGQDVGGVSS